MPADADWVLRGPFTDKALIRDALVYDLGREMGLPAPRYAFVELYLNTDAAPVAADDYKGVYMIVETIKNTKNRLDLKKLDEDDLTRPRSRAGTSSSSSGWPPRSRRCRAPGRRRPAGTSSRSGTPHRCSRNSGTGCAAHPAVPRRAALAGIRRPADRIPKYIDVDSFVDLMIVNELSREMDSYVRSVVLLQGPRQQDLRRAAVGLRPQLRRRRILQQQPDRRVAVPADPVAGRERLVHPADARPGLRRPGSGPVGRSCARACSSTARSGPGSARSPRR